jgi:hypothetical protein
MRGYGVAGLLRGPIGLCLKRRNPSPLAPAALGPSLWEGFHAVAASVSSAATKPRQLFMYSTMAGPSRSPRR